MYHFYLLTFEIAIPIYILTYLFDNYIYIYIPVYVYIFVGHIYNVYPQFKS